MRVRSAFVGLLLTMAATLACAWTKTEPAAAAASTAQTTVDTGSSAVPSEPGDTAVAAPHDASETAPAPAASAAPPGFGLPCPSAGACASGVVCVTYGDGVKRCTIPCKTAANCPAGPNGAGCNGKGYCKP